MNLTEKEIEVICKSAISAPSGGNVQPWIIELHPNFMYIKLDPIRSVSFLDVERVASILSLGCFLENILITSEYLGIKTKVNIFDVNNVAEPAARIEFTSKVKPKVDNLYKYILKRCTNRKIANGQLIEKKILQELNSLAKEKDTSFSLLSFFKYEEKKTIAEILGKADVIRNIHEESFKQMMEEFRWTEAEVKGTRDGIDIETLELPKFASRGLLLLKNFPHMRKVVPKKTFEDIAKPLLEESSHICSLNMSGEFNNKKMLLIGQALEKIWLTMTKYNLALQPWTIITLYMIRLNLFKGKGFSSEEQKEIGKLQKELRKALNLADDQIPIFIFRLSESDPPTARSLRRDWKEFIQ